MFELDRDMERVARAAAISQDVELLPLPEPLCHFAAKTVDLLGIRFKESLFHLHAFPDFAQNVFLSAHGFRTVAAVYAPTTSNFDIVGGHRPTLQTFLLYA